MQYTRQTPQLGSLCLADEVWEESHEARLLDGVRELALVPDTDAGTLASHDLAEGRQVAAQGVGVFVVDGLSVHLAEVTTTFGFYHKCL